MCTPTLENRRRNEINLGVKPERNRALENLGITREGVKPDQIWQSGFMVERSKPKPVSSAPVSSKSSAPRTSEQPFSSTGKKSLRKMSKATSTIATSGTGVVTPAFTTGKTALGQ